MKEKFFHSYFLKYLWWNNYLWHFFHIVLPTYQWLCSETYFINFNAYNEFLCLQCQFQCLKWILVLTMLPISIVPTGQFFVVRMIHEASRLSHLSPQFIKKIAHFLGRVSSSSWIRTHGPTVSRSDVLQMYYLSRWWNVIFSSTFYM